MKKCSTATALLSRSQIEIILMFRIPIVLNFNISLFAFIQIISQEFFVQFNIGRQPRHEHINWSAFDFQRASTNTHTPLMGKWFFMRFDTNCFDKQLANTPQPKTFHWMTFDFRIKCTHTNTRSLFSCAQSFSALFFMTVQYKKNCSEHQ